MPTADRRAFLPTAIACFLRQDYPACQLVVVDDGLDPVADLMPPDARVTYLRLDRHTALGTKRNIAAEAAAGDVLVHWDDDDWSSPGRVAAQVAALDGADVCGLDQVLWRRPRDGRAWQYRWSGRRPWVAGNTLAYRRAVWRRTPFRPLDIGEDTAFVWGPGRRTLKPIGDESLVIGTIHPGNTSRKTMRGREWQPVPADYVDLVMRRAVSGSDHRIS
jgi:glycosyltransferase involved in cell wall biosynthesis